LDISGHSRHLSEDYVLFV